MKPDFSGEYVLDRDASSLSPHASAIATARMRITHDEPRFRCSARFASQTGVVEFSLERFTDGREVDSGDAGTSRCYWEQEALAGDAGPPSAAGNAVPATVSPATALRAGPAPLTVSRQAAPRTPSPSHPLPLQIARRAALAFLLATPLGRAAAQGTVPTGLDPARLRPAADTVAVTVEVPGRTIPFATALESLRRVTRAGHPAWEQVYQWYGNDGSRTADTLWFDATTLRPIENHRHNGVHDAEIVYAGSAVHTRLVPRGGTEQVTDTMIASPLFASGELAALIRASPLREGYAATYPLYYGPPRAVRPAPIRVVRSEMARTRNGSMVDCWVVDANLSEGLNTFYVSKADHRVIRLVNHEDPNAAFVFTR